MKRNELKMLSSLTAGMLLCTCLQVIGASANALAADDALLVQSLADTAEPTAPDATQPEEETESAEDEPEDATEPTEDATEPTEDAPQDATEPAEDEPAEDTETTVPQNGIMENPDGTHSYYYNGEKQYGKFDIVPDGIVGDIEGDDAVSSTDAASLLIAAAIAGSGTQTAEEVLSAGNPLLSSVEIVRRHADVNADSVIDAADAAIILQYAAAIGSNLPVKPLGYAAYFADENGVLQRGQVTDEDGLQYYAQENYTLLTGWLKLEDGTRYYNEDNVMLADETAQIGGNTYCFDEAGCTVCAQWLTIDGQDYYFTESGARAQEWQTIDGSRYYFDKDGIFLTGWQVMQDGTRYFDENGVMHSGWLTLDGKRYHFNANGLMYRGFVKMSDGTRYFTPEGVLLTGWQVIEEKTYCFNEDGLMAVGWQTIDGSRYHFNANGILSTGLVAMTEGTYYFGTDGIMQTGWQTIDNVRRYFGEDGIMVTNQTVDGYVIDADGVAMSQELADITARAHDILKQNGSGIKDIYNYVRSTNRYKKIESTKTLEQIEEIGWTHFVSYSMDHYYVVCYYEAAKMDFLLREAGYTCRVVHATHGTGDHYWNQVLVNGTWVNYDCTNGYKAYGWNAMISAGDYIVLGYLIPEYK